MDLVAKTTSNKAFNSFGAIVLTALMLVFSFSASASEGEEGEFKAGDMIMHHIADAHQIHIIGEIHIPLPVILWHDGKLDIFSSSKFWDGYDSHGHLQFKPYTAASGITYVNHHEIIEVVDGTNHISHSDEAIADSLAKHTNAHNFVENVMEHERAVLEDAKNHVHPVDLSITKSVFGMFLVLGLMLWIFISIARSYKKRQGQAPKGLQNALEPFILFIRDEVAVPSMGKKKAKKFLPFLLTVFFFIWLCNMLGLIPFIGGFNVTGTLGITLVLATFVFLITSFSGNKHYWGHIFWPPGVPLPIKFILVPIEVLSIFIKPAVLMIRLTANITAGHILILAFVSLVLIFGQNSAVAGYGVGVGAVLFMTFMFCLELLVAFLQAYVFTLLTALYFGDATQDHHHEEAHH
jgi:F-type H+-transporting ATPase subunit a